MLCFGSVNSAFALLSGGATARPAVPARPRRSADAGRGDADQPMPVGRCRSAGTGQESPATIWTMPGLGPGAVAPLLPFVAFSRFAARDSDSESRMSIL